MPKAAQRARSIQYHNTRWSSALTRMKMNGCIITKSKWGMHFNCTAIQKISRDLSRQCQTCEVCGKQRYQNGGKILTCSACKNAEYCSPECQKLGWDSGHKKACQQLRGKKATCSKRQLRVSIRAYMNRENNYVKMERRMNGTWLFKVTDKNDFFLIDPVHLTPEQTAEYKATLPATTAMDNDKVFSFQAGDITMSFWSTWASR